MNHTAWRVAVIGAGPVGLALALHGARVLPEASFTVYDARAADRDVSADPRTLALALGSVMFLQRLSCWPAAGAAPITSVHVSQAPPSPGQPEVLIDAREMAVKQLGAVLGYGALVAPMQRAWEAACAAEPARLALRLGTAVASVATQGAEVAVQLQGDSTAQHHDLAVVAEGGVFAEQAKRAIAHDYRQTAWVGNVVLEGGGGGNGATDVRGRAYERFTRQGPAALLPLPDAGEGGRGGAASKGRGRAAPPSEGRRRAASTFEERRRAASTFEERRRAALVWCVNADDDPVRPLSPAQRVALLNTVFPAEAGRIVELAALKDFALGLNAERTLVQGRVVRIGNAAQTLHPVAGQGLNLGLRDAHALVAALRGTDDLERALKRVEWARAPDRWATIATTDFLARSFTWNAPGMGALRAAGLAAVQRLPPLKDALARRMMFGGR